MELCIKVLGTLLRGASRWDNLGHVAGETENPADRYSHVKRRYVALEVKSRDDAEMKLFHMEGVLLRTCEHRHGRKLLFKKGLLGI
ncbi:hypothetical protein GIB67_031649 [Kingdonia uniflora]|uniref:Uncharacterized protein n=1 Tax=Kingdonia uniflora TaxID=39325 RepID=A0A7J7NKL3_9MAGN|nr:hypothetical protein GIB67_031649 [Kingdonia uniflora]